MTQRYRIWVYLEGFFQYKRRTSWAIRHAKKHLMLLKLQGKIALLLKEGDTPEKVAVCAGDKLVLYGTDGTMTTVIVDKTQYEALRKWQYVTQT